MNCHECNAPHDWDDQLSEAKEQAEAGQRRADEWKDIAGYLSDDDRQAYADLLEENKTIKTQLGAAEQREEHWKQVVHELESETITDLRAQLEAKDQATAVRNTLLAASASAFDQKYDRLLRVVRAQEAWAQHIIHCGGDPNCESWKQYVPLRCEMLSFSITKTCDEGKGLWTELQTARKEAGLNA